MLVRLSRAPVVSIASIRGRAAGVGSELALAATCVSPAAKKPSCPILSLDRPAGRAKEDQDVNGAGIS
jgi:hypothetical protein